MDDLIIDVGIDAEYIDLGVLDNTTVSQNNNLSFAFDGNLFDESTGYNIHDIYNVSLDRDTSITINNISTSSSDANSGISVVVVEDTNNNGLLDFDTDTVLSDDAIDTTNGDESLNVDLSTGNYLLWVSLTGSANQSSTESNIDDFSLNLDYSLDINTSDNNNAENNSNEDTNNAENNTNTENTENTENTDNTENAENNTNIENSDNTETISDSEGNTDTTQPGESSDGIVDAGTVGNNFVVVNTYESGSGQDSYQFEVAQTGTYDVELANLEANLDISIADSEGNVLYSSSESGNTSEYIAADFQAGSYQAYITGEGDAETSYSFEITQTSTEDNSDSGGDSTEDSTTIIGEGDVVYRFLETNAQTQFYTTSEVERDSVIENLPNYEYEGESFAGAPNSEEEDITGAVPVYRFFNSSTGVHLYTSSVVERDAVTENLPNYTSEGIAYYGYESQQEGSVALYRFYNSGLDAHFYTPSIEERDEFLASSAYTPEGEDGIAYYVQPITDI